MREVEYCGHPDRVELLPGTREALNALSAAGYLLVVITNQSGIGRGYFTESDFLAVQAELERQVGRRFEGTFFCPAVPGAGDPRRKPSPAMVLEAARDLHIDLAASWFIGDKSIDIECGNTAGTRTILVTTGYGAGQAADCSPYAVAPGILEAANVILGQTFSE